MMISRKAFCRAINFIEKQDEKENRVNNFLEKEFDGSYIFFHNEYATEMINLLKEATYDKYEWIDYFCWELEFGKKWKPNTVTENGRDIPLATADDLYNLLEEEFMNNGR